MEKGWLEGLAESVFEKVIRPSIYPGAKALVEADRKQGFRPVLITGELDFVLRPVMRYFGFDHLICNSLLYQNGVATGEVVSPLIAKREKVAALMRVGGHYNADTSQP